MQQPFIQLCDITKTYYTNPLEPVQILKGINLTIHHGDFTAIMGPS